MKHWNCIASITLICLLGISGCSYELSTEELIERGKYLSDTQRAAEAIPLFDELAELAPSNPEVFYMRGLSHERTGSVEKAIEDYSRAISVDAQYVQAYNNRAVLYAQQGKTEKAIEDFSSLLQLAPQFALGYKNRGLAYHDHGDYQLAEKDFNQAIKIQKDAQCYFLRGNLRIELKQYQRAIEDYEASLELEPSNSRAWLNRSLALAREGDLQKARESLRKATEIDSEVISSEILFAFRSLFAETSLGVSLDLEDVRKALGEHGWTVQRSDDDAFPFVIQKGDQTRKLFVGMMDVDQKSITAPATLQNDLVDSEGLSLLVVVDSPKKIDTWRFVEQWKPKQNEVRTSTISILLSPEPQ